MYHIFVRPCLGPQQRELYLKASQDHNYRCITVLMIDAVVRLDLVSPPQSLGLPSALIYSGLGLGSACPALVLILTWIPTPQSHGLESVFSCLGIGLNTSTSWCCLCLVFVMT